MALNKKYIPKKTMSTIAEKIQGYYPVFLPNYTKISAEFWDFLFSSELMMRQYAQREKRSYRPLFVSGLSSGNVSEPLEHKQHLPYFAKKQRLTQIAQKQQKKSDQALQSYLGKSQISLFSGTDFLALQQMCEALSTFQMFSVDLQLVYRDASLQTPVHAEDILRKTEQQASLQVKCFVEAKGDALILSVDDITTFFSDVAILVHNNDKRYKKYIGKNIILPIINKKIPILGAEGIDTLKDNGIVRINPLLSPAHFQKAKELGFAVDGDVIDDRGYLLDSYVQKTIVINEKKGETHVGVKYNLLENAENIIMGLREIGNLAEESQQEQQVAYSKLSGSRLIKKVVPLLTRKVDNTLRSDFLAMLEAKYPDLVSSLLPYLDQPFFAQVNNDFGLTFALREDGRLYFDARMLLSGKFDNPLLFLFASLLIKGQISSSFKIEECGDMLYLLSDQELEILGVIFGDKEALLAQIAQLRTMSADQLLDFFLDFSAKYPQISLSQDQLCLLFDEKQLLPAEKYHIGVRDEQILRILYLLKLVRDSQIPLLLSHFSKQQIFGVLLMDFLLGEKGTFVFDPVIEASYVSLWSEKVPLYAKTYGRDAVIFLFAQQIKPEESLLDEAFAYINHFRNLFKHVFEKSAFQMQSTELTALDLWIFEQYSLLEQEIKETGLSNSVILQKIQYFTKNYFSRYLESIKKSPEKNYFASGKMFLKLLQMLTPYLPNICAEMKHLIGPFYLETDQEVTSGSKDFKIHKLFAIIQKIAEQKSLLNLKKHQHIQLFVKGGPQEEALLEQNRELLYSLLSVKNIEYSEGNRAMPSGFKTFSLLDMEIGVADMQLEQQIDELAQLEQDLITKTHYLQTVKQTLIMLSNLPAVDSARLEEREDEYELVKDQIAILELKIQKLKMQKKAS